MAEYLLAVEAKLQEAEERLTALAAKRVSIELINRWKDALAAVRKTPNASAEKSTRVLPPLLTGHFLR